MCQVDFTQSFGPPRPQVQCCSEACDRFFNLLLWGGGANIELEGDRGDCMEPCEQLTLQNLCGLPKASPCSSVRGERRLQTAQ